MSSFSDAMSGIKQLLTLQVQVAALEAAARTQSEDMKKMARDLVELDKRLVRVSTIVEMTLIQPHADPGVSEPKRLENR